MVDLGPRQFGATAPLYGNRFDPSSPLPGWVSALSNNQWAEQLAQTNLIGDVVLPDQGQYGGTTPAQQHIRGHASSALITTLGTYGKLFFWSGGHTDYYGPEIYAYDLGTLTWEVFDATLPVNAAAAMSAGLADGIHLNGQPGVPHNWATLDFNESTNEFFSLIREVNNQGGIFRLKMTRYNVATKVWTNEATNLFTSTSTGIGQKLGMGADSTGHRWWFADLGLNPYKLVAYDFSDHSITEYNTPIAAGIGAEDPENMFVDRGANALLVFTNQNNFVGIDLSAPTNAAVALSIAGGVPTWLYDQGNAFNWSSNLSRIVVYRSRSDEVYFLDPPVGDWKTDPWVLTQLNTTGTTGTHSGSGTAAETYQKFRLLEFPSSEVVGVIHNNPSTNMKAIRIAA